MPTSEPGPEAVTLSPVAEQVAYAIALGADGFKLIEGKPIGVPYTQIHYD